MGTTCCKGIDTIRPGIHTSVSTHDETQHYRSNDHEDSTKGSTRCINQPDISHDELMRQAEENLRRQLSRCYSTRDKAGGLGWRRGKSQKKYQVHDHEDIDPPDGCAIKKSTEKKMLVEGGEKSKTHSPYHVDYAAVQVDRLEQVVDTDYDNPVSQDAENDAATLELKPLNGERLCRDHEVVDASFLEKTHSPQTTASTAPSVTNQL